MIMMEPKDIKAVLEILEGLEEVAVLGCGKCATANLVGGEVQVDALKERLEAEGKKVTDVKVIGGLCNMPNSRGEIEGTRAGDAVLVMACGAGAQAVAELIPDVLVVPGADAKFLGVFPEAGTYLRRCALCGDCIIHLTGGICPVARCPKNMSRGPCGDSTDGTCPVPGSDEGECVWVEISVRKGKTLKGKKDWQKASFPRDIILSDEEVKRRRGEDA